MVDRLRRLIINARGEEKTGSPKSAFPDKHRVRVHPQEGRKVIEKARKVMARASVSQDEATWEPNLEHPNLPFGVLLATDIHWGSIHTNYQQLERHLNIVEKTPNFGMVSNGDDVDNFNSALHASGMTENPLPPTTQAGMIAERLRKLDDQEKIGVMSFGNHNDFTFETSNIQWHDAFLRTFKAPIFAAGGLLRIILGKQEYKMGITHQYWGKSKLNPTNSPKRLMEYEFPQADIVFTGHTHQSSYEHFDRGGKEVVAVVGGTYKNLDDPYARKKGIGRRPGKPGITAMLWPDERKMEVFKDIETARTFIQALLGIK